MWKKHVLPFLAIGLGSTGIAVALFYFGLFTGIERTLEDLLFIVRPHSDKIIILAIDDASLAYFGQWPWPRETFAKIIKGLDTLHPKAIGIDINFTEPSRLGPSDDKALEDAIKNSKTPIILAEEASPLTLTSDDIPSAAKTITPRSQFLAHAHTGYTNVIADSDGIVRSFPPLVKDENHNIVPHFALGLAKILRANVALPQQNILRINFSGPPGTFHTASLALKTDKTEEYKNFTQGKIVIIGATAESLQDVKPVPTSHGELMAGPEIHAHILDTLLSGNFLLPISFSLSVVIMLMLAAFPTFGFSFFRGIALPTLISFIGIILFVVTALMNYEAGRVIPLVAPSFSWLFALGGSLAWRSLTEEREKRRIRNTFSRYVSPDVLTFILENPSCMSAGGDMREATILFTDLEGFTKISESLPPERVIELLNAYFESMSPIVKTCRGIVDKFIGDAIMAFWCEPFAGGNYADRAVYAAFEMIKKIPEVNKELARRHLPPIHMRIGINSGPVIVGNIGSEDRLDFTVVGDTVNVASRLEALNKEYHSQILISEKTYRLLTEEFPLVKMGTAQVRGKTETVDVFGYREDASPKD